MSQFVLLRQKRFAPLFWTQFMGAFNDNFLKNALIIMVTFRSAAVLGLPSSQIVAMAGGIFILPFFLFSALAGQIADRYEKGLVVRWVKAAEVGIMILAAIGFSTSCYECLLTALFFMGLHSTFFGPIKYSILPQHLALEEMVLGNALVEAGTFLAILLGLICGGTLIALDFGPAIVSIGLTVVAGLGFWVCHYIPRAPAVAPQLRLQFNVWRSTAEIFGYARRSNSVFLCLIGISWFWFFGAVMLSVFPSLCKDVLHGDAQLVTLFLAAFSIGIGTGSMLTAKFSHGRLNLKLSAAGAAGISLASAVLYGLCRGDFGDHNVTLFEFISTGYGIAIVGALFLFSVSSGMFIVPLYTLMQESSVPSERSRVIAANNVLNSLFMVVASVGLIALLRARFSIAQIILMHGALNAVVAAAVFRRLPEFRRSH